MNLKINNNRAFKLLLIIAVISEIFYLCFIFLNGKDGNISLYMFVNFEAFILFFFSLFIIKKINNEDERNQKINQSNKLLKLFAKIISAEKDDLGKLKIPLLIILFGVIFRLTLFPAVPTTSPDVYRYVWEGEVIYNGFNPYLIPPNDPKLKDLRGGVYEKVTYKEMTAIYPPAAQFSFVIAYLISGKNLIGLKIIFLLCEIITMIFLLKLLYLKKMNLNLIILYAWLPLVIMEFFINIHIDVLGIMFLIIFLFLFEKNNIKSSAIFLALSFLSKLYPLLLLPLVLKKIKFKKFLNFSGIFLIVSIIFFLPFVLKGLSLFSSLKAYLSRWEFNGSVYNILRIFFSNAQTIHLICGILLICSIGIIAIKFKDFLKGVYGVFICIIIFSATLFPWYLGWAAALNPFFGFYSVMSLLFTINLTNFSPLGAVWHEYGWVLIFEYIPFFIFLYYDYKNSIQKN